MQSYNVSANPALLAVAFYIIRPMFLDVIVAKFRLRVVLQVNIDDKPKKDHNNEGRKHKVDFDEAKHHRHTLRR